MQKRAESIKTNRKITKDKKKITKTKLKIECVTFTEESESEKYQCKGRKERTYSFTRFHLIKNTTPFSPFIFCFYLFGVSLVLLFVFVFALSFSRSYEFWITSSIWNLSKNSICFLWCNKNKINKNNNNIITTKKKLATATVEQNHPKMKARFA